MSELVDSDSIEAIVGAKRHLTDHLARADSETEMVYILHSQECKDRYTDLRECPFSIALDRGIKHPTPWSTWRQTQDQPVRVEVVNGYLVPLGLQPPSEFS